MGDIRLRRWQLWSAGASEASEARPRFGSLRRGVPIPVVFGRRFALSAQPLFLSLSSSKRRRGPGRGGAFYQFPLSPALSPLVPREERERQNAAGVLRAEHNCSVSRSTSASLFMLNHRRASCFAKLLRVADSRSGAARL